MSSSKKKKVVPKKKKAAKPVIVIPPDNKLPTLTDTKNAALVHCVAGHDVQQVKRLVAHYNYGPALSTTDMNGSTPLHLAVRQCDLRMVRTLLQYQQIDVNAKELAVVGGYAAVHHACLLQQLEILELLLAAGTNANLKADSATGETPLHICCRGGLTEFARRLLLAGASADTRDNYGNNASFWAYKHRQERLIQDLHLPPAKAPTAEEFLQLLLKKNPNFTLPTIKKKKKKAKGKGKGEK